MHFVRIQVQNFRSFAFRLERLQRRRTLWRRRRLLLRMAVRCSRTRSRRIIISVDGKVMILHVVGQRMWRIVNGTALFALMRRSVSAKRRTQLRSRMTRVTIGVRMFAVRMIPA